MTLIDILRKLANGELAIGTTAADGFVFEVLSRRKFRVTYPSGRVQVRVIRAPGYSPFNASSGSENKSNIRSTYSSRCPTGT